MTTFKTETTTAKVTLTPLQLDFVKQVTGQDNINQAMEQFVAACTLHYTSPEQVLGALTTRQKD